MKSCQLARRANDARAAHGTLGAIAIGVCTHDESARASGA
jgi:hypothetical protein